MAKRGLKIFGLGIGGLIVVVGILVGILFATGVIKVPSKDSSSPGSADENKDEDILHPTKYCADTPNVTSFEKVTIFGSIFPKYRISWSEPIKDQCESSMEWYYCLNITDDKGRTGQSCTTFRPTAGQTYYDITLDKYRQELKGNVWLKVHGKDGSGKSKESNKYPFTILPSN